MHETTDPTELLQQLARTARLLATTVAQIEQDHAETAPPLRKSMHRALERQFLVGDNRQQKGNFETIRTNSRFFSAVVRACGRRLEINSGHGYAGLLLERGQLTRPRRLSYLETTVLLQLALLYEGAFERMELSTGEIQGEAHVELSEAIAHYVALLNCEAPARTSYEAAIKSLSALGVCVQDCWPTSDIEYLRIRPTIRLLVTPELLNDCDLALSLYEKAAILESHTEVANG